MIAFAAPPQVVEQGPGRISLEWIGVNRGTETAPAGSLTDVVTVNERSLKLTLHQELAPGASYTSAFPIGRLLAPGDNRVSIQVEGDAWSATVNLSDNGHVSVSGT